MTKHTFYAPPEAIAGDTIVFPGDEATHAIKVLRLKSGDETAVVDGAGNWYRVACEVVGRRAMVGRILERRTQVGEPGFKLTIGLSPIKATARFEMFVEKAAELGVSRIVPLITKRTERSRIKESRIKNILIGAMKQSGRSCLIQYEPALKFRKYLKGLESESNELRGVCHETSGPDKALLPFLSAHGKPANVSLLIGPEGGFTDEEIDQLENAGFQQVHLGPRRLRAETAAITAAAGVMMAYNS